MPAASPVFFTKEHIESHALAASPALAEQAIHCLELVAELSDAGLSFQFKGGNSLLLVLGEPMRFSIDVDIATDETPAAIEAALDKIVRDCRVFVRWTKRQHKTKPWLPLASFYLFYKSLYVKDEEAFVMLDAQLTQSPYATRRTPVVCGELYESTVTAEVPLAASIIGDKLLTLGPETLGIPVGKGKESQRLKHVFDVSRLLAENPLLEDIRRSFTACVKHENALQEKSLTAGQILSDTLLFFKPVVAAAVPPQITPGMQPVLAETVVGLPGFASHLFKEGYSWADLRRDMGRAGLCITAVCSPRVSQEEFTNAIAAAADDPEKLWRSVAKWLEREEHGAGQRM
ncbi:MAG TPA: nucleotidyl transferase AbiEii/AbiGii toxin family protein [Chitinivibrionales bacterium]|nr:nucleotidyl transferase AbiEii/AbiGii toxin family protein [Chitinivibrionales bacterium]